LDLLKDEYVRRYKQKPTNEQLYQFDPKPGSDAFVIDTGIPAKKNLEHFKR